MKPLQSIIVLLLAVALGVVGAQWLGAEDLRQYGEVIFRHGGTDYRSTLPQVALLVLVALMVLWLAWSLMAAPFRAWGRYRRKQGRVRLIDGLQAYEQGHWQRAEKLFDGAAQDPEVSAAALTGAVRSARARADTAAAEGYLQRLAAIDATAAAVLRAEQQLGDDLPVDAINTLDAANVQPLPPRGLWLRGQALELAGRAHDAYGELGALRQSKVLPADELAAQEQRLAMLALQEAPDVNALAARWEATPKALRRNPDVVLFYANRAAALGWDEPALLALEQSLDANWSDTLVQAYGQLPASRLATREANLARWRRSTGDSAALLLAQGRVALAQGRNEDAVIFLHEAIAAGAGEPAWEVLGLALLAKGAHAQAAQALANARRVANGETALVLEETVVPADAGTPPPRATVEELGTLEVPPVYDAGDVRDENGFPRRP